MLLSAIVAVATCTIVEVVVGVDPVFIVEVVGTLAIATWTVHVVAELQSARAIERVIRVGSSAVVIGGVTFRMTPALGSDAVVIGAVRPTIYVGRDLVATLDSDEIIAVLFHEEHHRSTLAPLRAAALTGWLRMFGRAGAVRRLVLDRLTDLETTADMHALNRGSTPDALARALLVGGAPTGLTTAFSYAGDRRVEHLLLRSEGIVQPASRRLPVEWLPIAMVVVASVACSIG